MHFKSRSAFFFDMKALEIFNFIENWAPKEVAWQKDNVGLQVGSKNESVKNILISLEITGDVVKQAINKKCNLIITHHPFLFHSLKKIDSNSSQGKIITDLIKNNITVYSAHTNLDFTLGGVSFILAEKLDLKNISFLINEENKLLKLSVFVPKTHYNEVLNAMFKAGAGKISEYDNCSFRVEGTGTFRGSEKSNPSIGKPGSFEEVEEYKIEVILNQWMLSGVLKVMKEAHPYEEVAYDVYSLQNEHTSYGAGAIGTLEKPLTTEQFLKHICSSLNIKNFRYTNGNKKLIQKVAVCGGSGSELLNAALNKNADAYITADIKYHTFHDAWNNILLIDAGHYETERFIIDEIQKKLTKFIKNNINVYKYNGSTNPVRFFNN